MKKLLFLLSLLCIEKYLQAQKRPYVYTIRADSVLITNNCDTAELILENHTQNVPGFLYNKGRGRTEFRRAIRLNDSTIVLGGDTIVILGNPLANNGLSMAGKTVQLGQLAGDAGNPAALVSNREIPMNGFDLQLKNVGTNDAGYLKLYSGTNKTAAGPYIQFLDTAGAETGRINFQTDLNNMMIGRNAGRALTSAAIRNCFVGNDCGRIATTASRNTAIGNGALYGLTTGSSNVAVGGAALTSLTTGIGNFAMGYTAAGSMTTGTNNISIGGSQFSTSALQNLQSGNNNIAIGIGALAEATVSTSNFSDNIGIGFKCFYYNTLGNRNIGIGDSLCFNSLVGTNNILLGSNSISNGSQVGNSNVILSSLLNSSGGGSIGDNNVILGSGFTTTSAIKNTVVIGQGITNNQNNIVRLGRGDQNIIIGATSDQPDNRNRIQVLGTAFISDTLKMPNMVLKTDTAGYKPMVVDNNGNVFKLSGWGISQLNRTPINDVGYSALASDYLVAYTSLTAARTVTLPAASGMTNHIIIVKDETGSAATYNITINVTAGGTIDGASSKTISTNYGVIEMYSNGSQWLTK